MSSRLGRSPPSSWDKEDRGGGSGDAGRDRALGNAEPGVGVATMLDSWDWEMVSSGLDGIWMPDRPPADLIELARDNGDAKSVSSSSISTGFPGKNRSSSTIYVE